MASIDDINTWLLLGALLVVAGILSSLIARRFGAPLLLVFIVLGMLAGEDGPGNIAFSDYKLTYLIGALALSIILFDGGLRTKLASFRGTLAPAVLLATLGVVLTAVLTGLFGFFVLGLGLVGSLLLGAIVASTDPAAVFFLSHSGGLELKGRLNALLEIESGLNDPVAVILTIALIEAVLAGQTGTPGKGIVLLLLSQGVIGAALGIIGGSLAAMLLNRVTLPSGLHPLFVVASAVLIYSSASLLHGSGFLAVYLAGLSLGNRPIRAYPSIASFHDAATWLAQIVMFLVLGLLVTPSTLATYAAAGIAIALFLMFVARPIAVWLCLSPFGFRESEKAFVSWVGLRGAVSIFLAAIPTLSGVPGAEIYFNVAFFVVLVSLIVQGWTIAPVAKRLGVALPQRTPSVDRIELDLPGQIDLELVGYPILPGSQIAGRHVRLPAQVRAIMVVRSGEILTPEAAGRLGVGDYAYFLAPPGRIQRLDRMMEAGEGTLPETGRSVFGEFAIAADAHLGDLAALYELDVLQEERPLTIAELFHLRFDGRPLQGDQIALGEKATLIARKISDERVAAAGLQLEEMMEALTSIGLQQLRTAAWKRFSYAWQALRGKKP